MSEQALPRDESSVRRVLRAEDEARLRIEAAEREAAENLERERAEARRIEARAVERAHRFRTTTAESADHKIAVLGEAAERRLVEIEGEQLEPRIKDAAERLARELIRFDDGGETAAP